MHLVHRVTYVSISAIPVHTLRLLLNYLRTGKVILPDSKYALQELLLEAEYYCIDDVREAVQRALGGLKFEDSFSYFHEGGGVWKEAAIRTYCAIDKVGKTMYQGIPHCTR